MKTVRPRSVVHAGVVPAVGFLFDASIIEMAEVRRRVVCAWTAGAQVFRLGTSLVLRLPVPTLIDTRSAKGTPLTECSGVVLAAPLDSHETARLSARRGDIVIVSGGVATVAQIAPDSQVQPERWIDLSRYRVVSTVSLGAPPEKPRELAAKVAFDPRAALSVGDAVPEQQSILTALAAPCGPATGATFSLGARAVAARAVSGLVRGVGAVQRIWRSAGLGGSRAQDRTAPRGSRGESAFDRMAQRLDRLAARLAMITRLDGLIGRMQAEYLGKMVGLLEEGDIANGLRHAIPLGALESLGKQTPALGTPRPRHDLSITPHRTVARSTIGMSHELIQQLRQLYRDVFVRLEAQGRIQEAAFVLAELLRCDDEAVNFLERHGQLRLAAEMAEARELSPGLVVRQWFVAGDRERAVAIARRTGAFADAVLRLEKTDRAQAATLRLLWATSLADAGDFARAVDAAWPVEDARTVALAWMERAIESGGHQGARMLAKALSLQPDGEARERAIALMEDETRDAASLRVTFGAELSKVEKNPATRALARLAARALIRDAPVPGVATAPANLNVLVNLAADGALRADLPPLASTRPNALSGRSEPVRLRIDAGDTGTIAIRDAVVLPNSRLLVALGEAGALLLRRDGSVLGRLDDPAHHIVASDHGDRAIVLAPRGDIWRLARLDLLNVTSRTWCDSSLESWADTYDGSIWFLGARGDFYAMDATAERWDALWRVPDVEGETIAVGRSAGRLWFLTAGRDVTLWTYGFPSLRLYSRDSLAFVKDGEVASSRLRSVVSPTGVVADATRYLRFKLGDPAHTAAELTDVSESAPEPLRLQVFVSGRLRHRLVVGEAGDTACQPACDGRLIAVPIITPTGARVRVYDVETGAERVDIVLEGAQDVALRFCREVVVASDDRGRVLVLDVETGGLLRNVRI